MSTGAQYVSGFLRPVLCRIPGTRIAMASWQISLLVLAILAALRYDAVLGPPQARILFLVHCLIMWAIPLILTPQGRREIGLPKQGNTVPAMFFSALAGAGCGLTIYAIGMALYGTSPEDWNISIRESFQIDEILAEMPPAAALAVIVLPAIVLTPIGQEMLFRGLIQQAFTMRWSVGIAAVVNGLGFGLMHLHVHGIWQDAAGLHLRLVSGTLMVLLLAGASAVFTLCRLRSGSLWTAMIAHAACNLAMIAAVFFHPL